MGIFTDKEEDWPHVEPDIKLVKGGEGFMGRFVKIPNPKVFHLVHEGGHHEVWCNGTIHFHTYGGKGHPEMLPVIQCKYKCNCELFKTSESAHQELEA